MTPLLTSSLILCRMASCLAHHSFPTHFTSYTPLILTQKLLLPTHIPILHTSNPLHRSQCLHIYSPTIHTHIHTESLRKANAYVLSNPRYLTHCSTQNPSTFTKASFESFATSCHHNLQHLPQIRRKLLLTVPFHVERRSLGRFPRFPLHGLQSISVSNKDAVVAFFSMPLPTPISMDFRASI